jgi:hypothetical protein
VTLSGCSNVPLVRANQLAKLDPYSQAKTSLPPVPQGAMRLYIYRPNAFVGLLGNAIVAVDGRRMGNPSNPTLENLLLPGAVFVVDTPAKPTLVSWEQGSRGSDPRNSLSVSPEAARTSFLRWELAPTRGYLQAVPESEALPQIEQLRLSGYVSLMPK